jgi:hypothetical protein
VSNLKFVVVFVIMALLTVPAAPCGRRAQVIEPVSNESFFPITPCHGTGLPENGVNQDNPQQSRGVLQSLDDAIPFRANIMHAAVIHDVDPALISAIIMAESSFNPQAVSRRGARGLMQLMPATARSLGVLDSFDPGWNIDGGVRYFRYLLDRFDGDVYLSLAAYNAGSQNVRAYRGVPPFRETRDYIKKVLDYQARFQSGMKVEESYEPSRIWG